MAHPVSDEAFARYVNQIGMASSDQIEEARAQAAASGIALREMLVRKGVITATQRDNVERIVAAQQQQGAIKQLGNYRILKKLGEGGMGAVYLAEDTVALRKVALKVLPRKHSADKEFLTRFYREARAAGKLNHVNIVAAYAVGEEAGTHFYVMEYCAGEPLDAILKRKKVLTSEKALEVVMQIARGLKHAHEHGFIHRDIKPANIFIGSPLSSGRGAGSEGAVEVAKILDLGLSKNILETGKSFHTQTGVALGTPHYISPEQACGEKNIDGRTDIYSLGATYYHLITGQTPFDGSSAAVVVLKHLNEQIPNPQDIREDISDEVVQVIEKMMAKDPADRYRDCKELLDDLELVIDGHAPSSKAIDMGKSSVAMPRTARRPPKAPLAPGRLTTGPRAPVGERERAPRAAPDSKQHAIIAASILGVGVVTLILALVLRGSSQPVATETANGKPKNPIAPTLAFEKKEENKPSAAVLSGEEAAAAEYEALLKSFKPEEIDQNIAKLEEFNARHGATLTGARARVERDRLRAPVGKWPDDWTLESGHNATKKPAEHAGRASILTHPLGTSQKDTRSAKWSRTIRLEAGQNWKLRGSVCSKRNEAAAIAPDWVLVVKANGEELLNQMVDGGVWQDFEVDLARFAGEAVTLELWNQAGGKVAWGDEQGYWADVRVENPNQPVALPILVIAPKPVAPAVPVPIPAAPAVSKAPASLTPVKPPVEAPAKLVEPPANMVESPELLKKSAEFAVALDALEKTLKAKPKKAAFEPLFKTLDELAAQLKAEPLLIQKFAERRAGLHFDALAARDGELGLYKALVKPHGNAMELLYDFSKPEQLFAWTWNDPADVGDVLPQQKKDALVLRCAGDRGWVGKERKNMPFLSLPFCFKGDSWILEAQVSLLSDKGAATKSKPSYGIMVFDGSASVVGLGAIESVGNMRIFSGGSTPANDKFQSPPSVLAGKPQDVFLLRMVCANGAVTFTATNVQNKMVMLSKVDLGFEPRYAGLFVRTDDAAEDAVVSFDNVTITAVPDSQKVADVTQALRAAAAAREKFLLLEAAGIKSQDWAVVWKSVLGQGKDARCSQGQFNERPNVWETHPGSATSPAKWVRKLKLEAGKKWWLRLDVSGTNGKECSLAVAANGKSVLKKAIAGATWRPVEVDLSAYAGQDMELELSNQVSGASVDHEELYWDVVRVEGE